MGRYGGGDGSGCGVVLLVWAVVGLIALGLENLIFGFLSDSGRFCLQLITFIVLAVISIMAYFLHQYIDSDVKLSKELFETKESKEYWAQKSHEKDNEIETLKNANKKLTADLSNAETRYNSLKEYSEKITSNLTAYPYMASIIAEIETYGLERLALGLEWGESKERLHKVKSIREIRKDAKAMVEKHLMASYQLSYLLELFPQLSDVIDADFRELPDVEVDPEEGERDNAIDYLSKEEYAALAPCERNQLALDRYFDSHKKSKWQIGRDYENYVAYQYEKKGYTVDRYGSYMGLEDLGRDLIATKGEKVLIVQCKFWSTHKEIHENHINQLFGTAISYCIENNADKSKVKPILVTNITLSETAKKFAERLGVSYSENNPLEPYPCIKCNIGRGEDGSVQRIYHLPFDQQYDSTKIDEEGEFYAMTVKEAEDAGFRRAFKWHGTGKE